VTTTLDALSTSTSAWKSTNPERPGSVPRDVELGHAAWVQHSLSTADRLNVGPISSASHSDGLLGPGGDFVDLLDVQGHLLAVLGDVSGKGVAASLVAAVVLASVQHHVETSGLNPGALLAKVDQSVSTMLDRTGVIVTLAVALVNPFDKTVRLASAGHHPVVLASETRIEKLGPTCPPLGADHPCGDDVTSDFTTGTALLITSDGLTEQTNSSGEQFGLDRLARLADDSRRRSPSAAVAGVLHAVDFFSGQAKPVDDRAIVVVRSGPHP
jgi:phosphoserine phosphatase RsbU/P